ncbi:MAG: hypothetical protein J5965_20275 [Aeriscardovia sp.]|nr:hypothetical protein [Aeriscardovia sp.]MBO6252406.1 hypothetical protein [Bacteroidaceae bacterium]MBP3212810.1 hypothetical protein [Prevotella sp.]
MKTKLFMLLTMMFVSMGAFAQSNEPLEGDVNKDGKVDVADIVKIIDIMAAAEQPQTTTYYSYVGTDLNELLVEEATGKLKSDIAEQIKTIPGVKTYTSIPESLETGITIYGNNNYIYVIAPTATLNGATTYLVNSLNMNVITETLGTFNIGSTEYTVKCTPSEVGTLITAWK